MNLRRNCVKWLQVAVVVGLLSLSTGCDPTLRASVENGVISVSTSFFGSLLQAFLALATEQAAAATTTGTTTGTTGGTALLLNGVEQPVFT